MLKFELEKKIDYIEESVFLGKFNEILTNVLSIAETIDNNKQLTENNFEESWKQILYYIMVSLENKDYLLVSDILKYELKPMLNNFIEES